MLAAALVLASSHASAQITRVLAVGDAWARDAEVPLESAFYNHGWPADVVSIGVPGSSAATWATTGGCSTILAWLAAFPTIDIVHIEVGASDLFAAWDAGMTAAETAAVTAVVALDVQAIADCAQAAAPNVEVLTRCYDFPNFQDFGAGQCGAPRVAMGAATAAKVNAALLALDAALAARAHADPRWTHIGGQGSTQALGGVPVDPAQPSPASMMTGCLALGRHAAAAFANQAWFPFYVPYLVGVGGYSPSFSGLIPGTAGVTNTLATTDGIPMQQVAFLASPGYTPTQAPGCPGMMVLSPWPILIGAAMADGAGDAALSVAIPAEFAGLSIWTQALLPNICFGTQAGRSIL